MTDTRFTPAHRGGTGSPMVCIHGITDTWRTWELVLPALEREHDVLAVTLTGHAGGPPLVGVPTGELLAEGVERAMDEAGFEDAHIVGNSLGGYVTLLLAARGRARTAVVLAPAGGWAEGDESFKDSVEHFLTVEELAKAAAPHADAIMATEEGRRRATQFTTSNHEHIPSDLLAHQLRGVAACDALRPLLELALSEGWPLDGEAIRCPVRVVWGTNDQILRWPGAAVRYRDDVLPTADWVVLDGIGHLPQLDVPLEAAQLILGFTRE